MTRITLTSGPKVGEVVENPCDWCDGNVPKNKEKLILGNDGAPVFRTHKGQCHQLFLQAPSYIKYRESAS